MRLGIWSERIFKGLVVLRALYAVLLCGGTLIYRLGLGNPIAIEENLGAVLIGMPLWYYAVWAGFVILYGAAATLLLARSGLALPLYALAFATDFLLSLVWFQQPAMDRAYYGSANIVEWILNAIDLTVIAVLLLTGPALTARAANRRPC
jgi:hypothetical protein